MTWPSSRARGANATGAATSTVPAMISYLQGHVIAADTGRVGGVGYQVATAGGLSVGADVSLWVHTAVRENDISLYGFATQSERSLFLALTKVRGVGAAVGLKLLSLGVEVLAGALQAGDAKTLSSAPGVGPKLAQTLLAGVSVPEALLVELAGSPAEPDAATALVAALVGLGFDPARGRAAVESINAQFADAPEPVVLRKALQLLNTRAT